MAVNVEILKKIKPKRNKTVYGYIREHYKHDVPDGVILTCLLFYGNDIDKWDTAIANHVKFDDDNRIVTHSGPHYGATSTFLTEEVDSGVHSWKFKVVKCSDNSTTTMHIGIWDTSKNNGTPPSNHAFHYVKRQRQGYAFATNSGQKRNLTAQYLRYVKYAEACRDGTIVDMIVDFDKLSISYMVNGKDYGKAYDIEPGKYRAAVYLYYEGDSYQLIEKY